MIAYQSCWNRVLAAWLFAGWCADGLAGYHFEVPNLETVYSGA